MPLFPIPANFKTTRRPYVIGSNRDKEEEDNVNAKEDSEASNEHPSPDNAHQLGGGADEGEKVNEWN